MHSSERSSLLEHHGCRPEGMQTNKKSVSGAKELISDTSRTPAQVNGMRGYKMLPNFLSLPLATCFRCTRQCFKELNTSRLSVVTTEFEDEDEQSSDYKSEGQEEVCWCML